MTVRQPSQHPVDPWLPTWFQPPARTELATGHHLRPLRTADTGLAELPWVPGLPGPSATCCYGVFDDEERVVLGAVVVRRGVAPYDVEARWTVVPHLASSALPRVLAQTLPVWLVGSWPFTAPRVIT